jgi:hypothetical protein
MDPNIYGHIANALFGAAYIFKEILWLRILSVVACVASILFAYYAPETPLWVSIYWDVFFIVVNLVHIVILIRERTGVRFSEEERHIYQAVFGILPPVDFMKFLKIANWTDVPAGKRVIENDSAVEELHVIHRGHMRVDQADGNSVELGSGAFLGEFAFITGSRATGDVSAAEESRLLSWRFNDLRKLFGKNPALEAAFQGVVGANLVRKIVAGKGEG